MSRPTLAERLARRLYLELPTHGFTLAADARVRRVYPSAADRNLGAWSWTTVDDADPFQHIPVGSQWPMRVVLTAPAWDVSQDGNGDITIDPPVGHVDAWAEAQRKLFTPKS